MSPEQSNESIRLSSAVVHSSCDVSMEPSAEERRGVKGCLSTSFLVVITFTIAIVPFLPLLPYFQKRDHEFGRLTMTPTPLCSPFTACYCP